MEFTYDENEISIEKVLNPLDDVALAFARCLGKLKYTYMSGYVAILFGRSRNSEDIDLFLEHLSRENFIELWGTLVKEGFECINAETAEEAYDDYLSKNTALRFAIVGTFIPNVEVKFPGKPLDEWSLGNRKRVRLNERTLYISPLEIQIPFKLHLGSDKDIEDARYLYKIFAEHLDSNVFESTMRSLGVSSTLRGYLE